jgi:hypothetical protein
LIESAQCSGFVGDLKKDFSNVNKWKNAFPYCGPSWPQDYVFNKLEPALCDKASL